MENINSQEENQRAEVAPGANTGRVTIPTDLDVVDQTLEVMKIREAVINAKKNAGVWLTI